MYAVRFKTRCFTDWHFCIDGGVVKTFENRADAENFAAETAECMAFCFPNHGYVYEVVEV